MTLPGASRGGSLANICEDKAATCRRLPCKPSTLPDLEDNLEKAKPAAPARRRSRLCCGAACTKAVLLLAALLLCTGWRPAVAAMLWAVVVRSDLSAASEMLQELVSSHCTNGTVVSFVRLTRCCRGRAGPSRATALREHRGRALHLASLWCARSRAGAPVSRRVLAHPVATRLRKRDGGPNPTVLTLAPKPHSP